MKFRVAALSIAAIVAFGVVAHLPARAQSMMSALPMDGIRCDSSEGAAQHIHTHLQIFNRGKALSVPGGIGIREIAGCLYWVHTHDDSGIIHIESPVKRTFTLGEFFDIWGKTLSRTQAGPVHAPRARTLAVTVNGRAWRGDPRAIPLRDHEEIVIQSGPPYGRPHGADWSKM